MSALIQSRLTPQTAQHAMVSARRFGGTEAAAAGIVDQAVDESALRTAALELARSHANKTGDTLGTIKTRMYAPVLTVLRDTTNPLN
ncbi:enoyl-CoA hydratase-related protein [Streptomyces spiralis]|uniref:enoyl-CoA hydratase-related protein n=1 Tax=Streptomyces spiralis TaxID=66376 RepID=UPI003F4CB05A